MSKIKIAVLGAGESGVGAAILAQKQGMEVWLSDKGKIKDLSMQPCLRMLIFLLNKAPIQKKNTGC
jgi:thioredoxin reductase